MPEIVEEHKKLFEIIAKIHTTIETELVHDKYDDIDYNHESYLYDFLGFLQNWLVNHILKVDKLIPQQ